MSEIKLLPCPFCGDRGPEITGHRRHHWIACTSGTDCAVTGPVRGTEADAIAAWNHRAHTDAQAARIAELERALKDLMSWFPAKPSDPEWRLRGELHGEDDAVEAARAALEPGA